MVIGRTTQTPPSLSLVRPRLKRLAIAAAAAALALAAARYGYDYWTVGRFLESTDDAYVGGDVTPISPHVAGFVAEILVADNQRVGAGELLIRLDDRDFRAAADHAKAIVAERQATLAGLEAQSLLQGSTIRQAKADLDAKIAQAAYARQDDQRYRELAQSTAGTRQNAEKALASNAVAQSAVAASQAGLDAARQQLIVLDAEIAQAKAAVIQAQADLQTASLNLGYTEIRSPIDGYVGNRAAEVGAYIADGGHLLTVIPAQKLWVDANFKEDQLAEIVPGQQASVVADIVPDHVFHGHVVSLAPGTGAIFSVIPPENATGNFTKIVQRVPVRIALEADDPRLPALRPGLSTTVRIDTRSSQGHAQ